MARMLTHMPSPHTHSCIPCFHLLNYLTYLLGTCLSQALWSAWELSVSKNKEKSLSSGRSDWEVGAVKGGGC